MTVALVLSKDGKNLEKPGTLTAENRQKVWRFNHNLPERGAAAVRPPPYEFESAKIVFRYSGQFDGTETFYVADSGKILVLDRDKKIAVRERKTTFWKDGKGTTVDHDAKQAFKAFILPADMDLSVRHATDAGLKQVGLERKGTEAVAGRECVLYEKKDGDKLWRTWRWKGIELKIEMKNFLNLSYVKEAASVEEGVAIPEALLKVPEGYAQK